ncbi:MAG: DNA primase [Planctomycetaceae bacterium]
MSLSTDFDLKERVRMAFDIVDVIGSHLELRPQGRAFVAQCPWHNDKRPSLQVNPQRQTWKCWVCNIGGDIFSYVMQRDGCDFREALQLLAEKAGIEFRSSGKKAVPGSPDDKAALQAAVKFAAQAYFDFLATDQSPQTQAVREYLAQRGINDDSRRLFQIGYSPDQWSWLLDAGRKAGHHPEVLRAAGLAVQRQGGNGHYDLFRGRLMFPIHDLQDRAISMGGRILPSSDPDKSGAKYINGPETLLFSKSRQLYGLNLARAAIQKTGHVLVMEGYTDVIAARQAGIEPVVAVLGTALGEQHIEILRRFVDRVVLVLDGDEAGRKRADQVLELFVGANVDLRIITLPGGADPAEFVAEYGPEALNDLADKAPDALDHKLANLIGGIDLTRDTHQATKALQKMLEVVAGGGNRNQLRTGQMLLRLSRTFGFPADELRGQLDQLIQLRSKKYLPSDERLTIREAVAPVKPPPAVRLPPLSGVERELFEIMIEQPELAAMALEQVDAAWLQSDTARMLLTVYRDLEIEGRDLDFNSVLMAIDSEPLKNQLVTLDESIQRRSDFVSQPLMERYSNLLKRFQDAQTKRDANRKLARLANQELDQSEAEDLLLGIIEAQRNRQGLLRP